MENVIHRGFCFCIRHPQAPSRNGQTHVDRTGGFDRNSCRNAFEDQNRSNASVTLDHAALGEGVESTIRLVFLPSELPGVTESKGLNKLNQCHATRHRGLTEKKPLTPLAFRERHCLARTTAAGGYLARNNRALHLLQTRWSREPVEEVHATRLDCSMWGKAKITVAVQNDGWTDSECTTEQNFRSISRADIPLDGRSRDD